MRWMYHSAWGLQIMLPPVRPLWAYTQSPTSYVNSTRCNKTAVLQYCCCCWFAELDSEEEASSATVVNVNLSAGLPEGHWPNVTSDRPNDVMITLWINTSVRIQVFGGTHRNIGFRQCTRRNTKTSSCMKVDPWDDSVNECETVIEQSALVPHFSLGDTPTARLAIVYIQYRPILPTGQ